MSSADNLCKQFGPRPGLTKCQTWSGSKLFDTQAAFLKGSLEKANYEKNPQNINRWHLQAYNLNEPYGKDAKVIWKIQLVTP